MAVPAVDGCFGAAGDVDLAVDLKSTPVVGFVGVSKVFQPPSSEPVNALRTVDLFVKRHESVAIIGPSGSGKSKGLVMASGRRYPQELKDRAIRLFGEAREHDEVAGRMPTALPLDALEMALWTREQTNDLLDGLIHQSGAGSQHTSILYTDRLIEAGALASIGTVGDSLR